ncbi:hypothetical protein DAMA08_024360 [Martiniozyma asiatica (nom. inval.)]|nr:hypothetical protein DAMA08_024360 [Martiniozyma asiatica]
MAFNVRNNNPKSLTQILTKVDLPEEYIREQNICIPLSDGTILRANIWFPKEAINGSKKCGTLVEYIPYRTDVTIIRDSIRHPFYAGNGLVSMRVDMRGAASSDGLLLDEYIKQEQDDALEVFDWIISQGWSNGNIGMFGKSWGGFNGLQIAARQHPALKTIITLMSTDDRYSDDVHYRGGCMLASDMLWWGSTMLAYTSRPQDPRIVGDKWKENWLKRLEIAPMVRNWVKHQTRDAYWKHGSVCEDWSLIDIPVLAIGGFRDGYTNPVFRMADNLANKDSCCLVGPWVHEYPEMAEPAPKIDYQQISAKWFKKWLCPNEHQDFSLPRLSVYIQDPSKIKESYVFREGDWKATNKPEEKKYLQLNLTGNNKLVRHNDGNQFEVKFSGDLSHGLFRGTFCPFGFKGDFPGDQKYEDSKCVYFDSEIFDSDVELMGLPSIDLCLSSDKKLANVSVRVVDIYPDNGEHVLISWGQLNLTHRKSHEFPEYLNPAQKYDINVILDAVGIKVAKGHKIRVALSTCDWPQAWPTAETPTLTLHSGVLNLPIVNVLNSVLPPTFGHATIMQTDIEVERLQAYGREKIVEYNYGEDMWILKDIQNGGCQKINNFGENSGFYFGDCNTNIWKINPKNPLSAENICIWTLEMGREEDNWNIKFEIETSLKADKNNFLLYNRIKAYENDQLISDKIWDDAFPRLFM